MNKILKFYLPVSLVNIIVAAATIQLQTKDGLYGGDPLLVAGPRHDWLYYLAVTCAVVVFYFMGGDRFSNFAHLWKSYGLAVGIAIIGWIGSAYVPDMSIVHGLQVVLLGLVMPITLCLLVAVNFQTLAKIVIAQVTLGFVIVGFTGISLGEKYYAVGGALAILLPALIGMNLVPLTHQPADAKKQRAA